MRISDERYNYIKELSYQCIDKNKENSDNSLDTIRNALKNLNNEEEKMLFKVSYMIPDDKKFLELYRKYNNNATKVAIELKVPVNFVITKVWEITKYNKELNINSDDLFTKNALENQKPKIRG